MAGTMLDEELTEGLKQAKKGPRNFALIAKGPNPVKLMVRKKKFSEGLLAKTKAEAKGNDVITGVLVASGADFAFQVLAEPTVKPIKLKELIAEQTEMTAKPRWEVVTALPEIGEEEEQEPEGQETTSSSTDTSTSSTSQPATDGDPMSGWKAAREDVIARLRAVGKEIAAANVPDSAPALIELKAVIANLTAEPSTPQQVAAIRRYLEQDDVVLDVCELAYDIRTPLLAALDRLTLQPTA